MVGEVLSPDGPGIEFEGASLELTLDVYAVVVVSSIKLDTGKRG
jgi:hypothetical protein